MPGPIQGFKQPLSPRQRVGVLALALAELNLKVAAARDIKRRPADQIRGSKRLWRPALLVNTIGPLGYFWLGRRRQRSH